MEELISYLLQFGNLNQEQIAMIQSKAKLKTIPKGAYFSQAGKIADKIGYITEGVFRVCYYDKAGEGYTRYFVYENRFVADINSFRDEVPSAEYIEAVTDCKLLVFSKEGFEDLSNTITGWSDIFLKITSYVMENKMKASSNMLVQDAHTRYLHFLEYYPGLANRVPLSMLASYLGITASSLSRIRKK
ncbi:CRP-like cAMP-binding protein [Pedobacter cryoconitis]|uniref:Crp/Fnr family transcriptional regulator n=1 Tax=Pedobacter cryoconitis TaxID=188932 RepID=UPI00161CCB30|nr:Crp/Fnr family transcriptional regulator [Pedobacter cryoconitis]MBB6272306.1 CRP-like cAMP-binding protein [Pedobacter cryoconitis]